MSEHYPRVRFEIPSGYTRVREGLNLTFYMPPRHPEFAESVLQALDLYLRYVGPHALGRYANEEGEWAELDEKGWDLTRRELREWECPLATLKEASPTGPWPEAGDIERGEVLPAYRELARVLEPWLYQKEGRIQYQSKEESRRWERRFLD